MIDYRVGDVRDRLAEIPDGSVDLVTCSPPFLALRSYLPEGHESKHAEIGSEATPSEFMSTLLGLAREWRRILAPHGSIAIELGDTYAGSGGAGGDYAEGGMRDGQGKARGSGRLATYNDQRGNPDGMRDTTFQGGNTRTGGGRGWPLPKSLCGLPTLFAWSLAYGRNLLDPTDTLDPWRVRNVIVWARPNPAVGALGDKYRPATSYITVACPSDKRWFDLDAVRTGSTDTRQLRSVGAASASKGISGGDSGNPEKLRLTHNPAGAPPLDHWTDDPTDPDDGDLTWKLSTEGSSLAHYAMWPSTLAARLVDSMCPREVCRECGTPRRRITSTVQVDTGRATNGSKPRDRAESVAGTGYTSRTLASVHTLGWSDCGHDNYRPGLVLDPFGGTGTTGAVADFLGRDAILIDLDPRNAELYPLRRAEVERKLNPTVVAQVPGQLGLLDGVA